MQHFIEIILKHLLVLWDEGKKSKNPDVIMSGPIGTKVENLHGKSKIEIDGKEVEVENLQPFVDIGTKYLIYVCANDVAADTMGISGEFFIDIFENFP